jgi:hypothetical protein
MIAAGLAAIAGLGVLAWYLQRPAPRQLRLSFARLLPDPPQLPRPLPRFALSVPFRSISFWLHLLTVLFALAAIWSDLRLQYSRPSPQIGLRLVLDISHGMGTSDGGSTRLEIARDIARNESAFAQAAAGTAPYCDEVVLSAQTARRSSVAELGSVEVAPGGADVLALLEAARLENDGCAITHVTVLSDLPAPATDWPDGSPALRWIQVGDPVSNIAISGGRQIPPNLDGTPASVIVQVATFGDVDAPALIIEGPDGELRPALEPSLDSSGSFVGRFTPRRSGNYIATLQDGGSYDGDDRVLFNLAAPNSILVDWRLPGLPAPTGVIASDQAKLSVVPLDVLPSVSPRSLALATYPGWEAANFREIGAFVEDPKLLGALNLDVLERRMPAPIPGPLPPGFTPVLTDVSGGVVLARRVDPPGLIVPSPIYSSDADATNLSLVLFYSALLELAGGQEAPLALRWETVSGQTIVDAWKESDTARPLLASEARADYTATTTKPSDQPIWPILMIAALVTLLFERLLHLVRRRSNDL